MINKMKKIIGLFAVVMVLVMMLSSCTMAGAPAGLLGKWGVDGDDYGYEFKSDDTVWTWSNYGEGKIGNITKCTCDEITIDDSDPVKYELSCDTLILKFTFGSLETTTLKRK